ncbi:MAG: hypothetical protein LBT46_11785 [Planctomycetaceae bacterium]|jgi:hypothetical protein|nr:hypothetical protein [Planctomycetaceae bacterium]
MVFLFRCIPVLVLTVFVFAGTAVSAQSPSAPILPELTETNVRNLMIPFEIHSASSIDPIKEVELLVSQDKGKHWHIVSRLPVTAKKFVYNAPNDGEYWFSFRTMSVLGNVSVVPSVPQLRAAVNTSVPQPLKKSVENLTGQQETKTERQSESGPITPPKPEKFRSGMRKAETPPLISEQIVPEQIMPEPAPKTPGDTVQQNPARQISVQPLPSFSDWEVIPSQNKPDKLPDDKLLDDILGDMDSFFDIQPAALQAAAPQPARNTVSSNGKAASAKSVLPSFPPSGLAADVKTKTEAVPAGKIAGLSLNTESSRPQVIVQWSQGDVLWRDAQIDVLRRTDKDGPWLPISMNLPNTGEYWWFVTQEDMKPFFLMLRIRSIHGGTQTDTTARAIAIKPEDMRRQ